MWLVFCQVFPFIKRQWGGELTIFIDKIYLLEGGGIWCFPFTESDGYCPSGEAPRCINNPVLRTTQHAETQTPLCEPNKLHPPSFKAFPYVYSLQRYQHHVGFSSPVNCPVKVIYEDDRLISTNFSPDKDVQNYLDHIAVKRGLFRAGCSAVCCNFSGYSLQFHSLTPTFHPK